jgi:hypothetical protein
MGLAEFFMSLPPYRKFATWDLLLVTIAMMSGVAEFFAIFDRHALLSEIQQLICVMNDASDLRSKVTGLFRVYVSITFLLLPFCVPWTVLTLMLRLLRPQRRHLTREPGPVACISAIIGGLLSVIPFTSMQLFEITAGSSWSSQIDIERLLFFGPPMCGCAVLGAWTGLILNVGWRSDWGWVDRVGCLQGLFWIGTIGLALGSFIPLF